MGDIKRGEVKILFPHADTIRKLSDRINRTDANIFVLSPEEKEALVWAAILVDDNNALHGIVRRYPGAPELYLPVKDGK